MKLVEFSVKNYRSIIQKSTIQIKDKTVIIGPNNEGKSNVMRALVLAFRILEISYLFCIRPYRNRNFPMELLFYHLKGLGVVFDWKDDYPHSLMDKDPKQKILEPICLTLTFDLNDNDKDVLSNDLEMNFNMDEVSFVIMMSDSDCLLKIQNGFEKHFSEKSYIVAKYIADHNKICYIDAVRTASTAHDSIKRLLSIETASITESSKYKDLLQEIYGLYEDKLKNLSLVLTESLKGFVPRIDKAIIEMPDSPTKIARPAFLEDGVNVLINDGENTALEQKGSGIQSLIALALAHTISVNMTDSKSFILAIEEPEAHLHPKGIHEIKRILFDIAKRNQLIITTHSPLLANTNDVSSNVIVSNNIARAAKSIKEIRDTLGIFASDNLMFADNNILVEGFSDERIIKTILMAISTKIEKAFKSDVLKIINCEGCSKVSSFVSLMKVYISRFYVILDGDKDGEDEKKRLEEKDPSLSGSITSFHALGMRESEIEDYIDPDSYADKLGAAFSLNNMITLKQALNDVNKKWSERLSDYGAKNGHRFDDEKEIFKAKTIVADAVEEEKLDALRDCRKDVFYTLAANIEKMLDE